MPEPEVHITWRTEPPSLAQLAAWRQLWDRLLGHVDPSQKREPQDPGAVTVATIGEQDGDNE